MSVQKLTQKRVNEAVKAGIPVEVRDAAARGLVLRVRSARSWQWTVRRHLYGRNNRLDLGDAWTLDEARELAFEVDRRVKARCDPFWHSPELWADHLKSERLKKAGIDPSSLVEPPSPAPDAPPARPEGACMRWQDALKAWIQWLADHRRPDTARSYRGAMTLAEMRVFEDRWVSEVTVEEVATAVAAIHARGAERQSRVTALCTRLFFKWMSSAVQRTKTGVSKGAMADFETPEWTNRAAVAQATNRNAARVPDASEIGLIAGALRDGASRIPECDRLAGLLVLYSCQRRRAVATATKSQFRADGERGGTWVMPPSHRKTAAEKQRRGIKVGDHVVALPPRAWAIVRRAMEIAGPGEWLFPATRERRAGQGVAHMDPSTLTHAYAAITGNACSPHDMRRGFGTTYRTVAGFPVEDVKLVLDHKEGVQADVTTEHYSFVEERERKWVLMQGWADFVDRCERLRD